MKITKSQLKEIIREELETLNESGKIVKTKSGLKIDMSNKSGHPYVKIVGRRGYVDVYGRDEIQNFCRVLRKGFRIV